MFENLIAIYSTKTAHTSPVYLYKPLMLQSKKTHQWFPSVLIYVDKISTCCCCCYSGTIGWSFKAFRVKLQMKESASAVMICSNVLSAVKETFMSASGPKIKRVSLFTCGLVSLQTHLTLFFQKMLTKMFVLLVCSLKLVQNYRSFIK